MPHIRVIVNFYLIINTFIKDLGTNLSRNTKASYLCFDKLKNLLNNLEKFYFINIKLYQK